MKDFFRRLTAAVITAMMVITGVAFPETAVPGFAYDYYDYLKDAATVTGTYNNFELLCELSEVISRDFPDYWENDDPMKNFHDGIDKLADEDDRFFEDYMQAILDIQRDERGNNKRVIAGEQTNSQIIKNQLNYAKVVTRRTDISEVEKIALTALLENDDNFNILSKAMMSFTDEYSKFIKATDYYAGQGSDMTGFGMTTQCVGSTILVMGVVPGGGADKAGLIKHDVITAINGESFWGFAEKDIPGLFGKEGEVADVTVMHMDNTFETIPIERIKVSPGKVTSETIGDTCIIRFKAFELMSDAEDFEKFYDAAAADPAISKLVIDIRDNVGGDTDVLNAILSVMTEKGTLLFTSKTRDPAKEETYYSEGKYKGAGKKFDGEVFVITNANTASCGDILTGVIKNIGGVQVGEPTYGKGIGQSGNILHNGYMAWITNLIVDMPTFGRYNGIPIEPDVPIASMIPAYTGDEILPFDDLESPLTEDSPPERIAAYQQHILVNAYDCIEVTGVLDPRTIWLNNVLTAIDDVPVAQGMEKGYAISSESIKSLIDFANARGGVESVLTKTPTDKALEYCLK